MKKIAYFFLLFVLICLSRPSNIFAADLTRCNRNQVITESGQNLEDYIYAVITSTGDKSLLNADGKKLANSPNTIVVSPSQTLELSLQTSLGDIPLSNQVRTSTAILENLNGWSTTYNPISHTFAASIPINGIAAMQEVYGINVNLKALKVGEDNYQTICSSQAIVVYDLREYEQTPEKIVPLDCSKLEVHHNAETDTITASFPVSAFAGNHQLPVGMLAKGISIRRNENIEYRDPELCCIKNRNECDISDNFISNNFLAIQTICEENLTMSVSNASDFFYVDGSVEVFDARSDVSGSRLRCGVPIHVDQITGDLIVGSPTEHVVRDPKAKDGSSFNLCNQIPGSKNFSNIPRQDCLDCMAIDGIWTAVGCIKHDGSNIVQAFIKIGLSVAGGSAIIMIMISGFMFSISKGDQKRTSDAKDMLTSAIIGLLFIIFSITILQFIGVSILQIPGFGGA